MGELFYYELDEPDSAGRQFLAIAADSAVDTAMTPKALFAAAAIARKHGRDTARSDSLYGALVTRFPESEYVRRAQDEMRTASPLKTRRERADEAYREAEKAYWGGGDTKAAVQSFFAVYKEFPDLAIAAKSLYAAAWITDNDLQKKKVAKSLYEKICERYPQSVYCVQEAQPRIKKVLDTLEALRRQGGAGKKDSTADSLGKGPAGASGVAALFDSLPGGGARPDSAAGVPAATKTDSAASSTSKSDSSLNQSVPPRAPDSTYFRGRMRYVPPPPADSSKK
jgi:hypothetical protein